MALANNGSLTRAELVSVLHLERTHVLKRLHELRAKKIVTSYYWGGNAFKKGAEKPPNWRSPELMWALDPRHPFYRKILAMARYLVKSFPLAQRGPVRWGRRYRRARTPVHALPQADLYVIGDRSPCRVLMMLSRRQNMRIGTLQRLLGLGKNLVEIVNTWQRWGVLKSEYLAGKGRPHVVSLDPEFCAYRQLRELCRAIDQATGSEFLALTTSRRIAIARQTLAQINTQRARRRAQNKPYFSYHGIRPARDDGRIASSSIVRANKSRKSERKAE